MLYLQLVYFSDIKDCGNFLRDYKPEGYDHMNYSQKLNEWEKLQNAILNIERYMLVEILVFYTQIVAVMIYLTFCIAFLSLKKRMNQIDNKDPF